MTTTRSFLALAAMAFVSASAFGQGKPCSKNEEAVAGKAIDRISSWATLNNTWKTYRHCDTGPNKDLFTESILRLVIDWKQVDQLANAMKDAEYREFILSHLKSPAAAGDALDVYSRARNNCPKGQDAFCKEISDAVKPAAAPAASPAPAAPAAPVAPAPPAEPKAPAAPAKT